MIYLLKPKEEDGREGPWTPWYDHCFGIVVVAENEDKARILASEKHSGERLPDHRSAWLDRDYSTCEPIDPESEDRIILSAVRRA